MRFIVTQKGLHKEEDGKPILLSRNDIAAIMDDLDQAAASYRPLIADQQAEVDSLERETKSRGFWVKVQAAGLAGTFALWGTFVAGEDAAKPENTIFNNKYFRRSRPPITTASQLPSFARSVYAQRLFYTRSVIAFSIFLLSIPLYRVGYQERDYVTEQYGAEKKKLDDFQLEKQSVVALLANLENTLASPPYAKK
eukprot:TRINITY_DN30503_c0_g1_i1.p1 TRINITY_DN30503_c0_g1~~TRINITY_DN30503_c0_g1_i1.p1  ORF type:complete len:196 (+),score=40.22 TRINITY_DN30503_c0_g1_i1:80-667(+)